jgi:hypothetical protein
LYYCLPIYEGIVDLEFEDELAQALLDIDTTVRLIGLCASAEADTQGVNRFPIHCEDYVSLAWNDALNAESEKALEDATRSTREQHQASLL